MYHLKMLRSDNQTEDLATKYATLELARQKAERIVNKIQAEELFHFEVIIILKDGVEVERVDAI